MATTSMITEAVYRGRYDDQMSAGAKAATDAIQKNTAAIVENEEKVTRATQSARTMVNRYDEVTKATNALATAKRALTTAEETLTKGVAAGDVTQDQATRTLQAKAAAVSKAQERVAALTAAYGPASSGTANVGAAMATSAVHAERLANNTRLTSQQIAALTPQINDLAVQMASGQGLFMPLIQQGTQITQIFGGLRGTMAAFAGALGPVGMGIAGVVAASGLLLGALNSQEGALSDLRAQMRGIPGDYRAAAAEIEESARRIAATTPGISLDQARQGLSYLRRSAASADFSFSTSQLEQLMRVSADFARQQGIELPEAVRKFGAAMYSSTSFVEEMVRSAMPGFTEALRRQVEGLVAGGRHAEAFGLIMSTLKDRLSGTARDVAPLTDATQRLHQQWERFTGLVTPFLAREGALLLSWLSGMASAATAVANALGSITAAPFWALNLNPLVGIPAAVRGVGSAVQGMITPGGTTPGSEGTLRGYIGEASRISGVSEDLIRIVQRMENQQNRDGSWRVSDAGAVGPMQVLPGTYAGLAQRYGIQGDVTNERSNVIAGALYLREMIDRYSGNLQQAITAYHSGPGNVDSGNIGPNGRGYWNRFEGQWVNGNPAITGPIDRSLIANGSITVQAQRATVDLPPGQTTTTGGQGLAPTSTADVLNIAMRLARGQDSPYEPNATVEERQVGLRRGLVAMANAQMVTQDPASLSLLAEGQRRYREELERTRTPQQEALDQLRLQGASVGIVDAAQRQYTQSMAQWEDQMRRAGVVVTDEMRNDQRAEVLRQINASLEVNITQTERAASAQSRIAEAYLRSTEAGQRQEFLERARTEIVGNSVLATEASTAAINRRADALQNEARRIAENASAQDAARSRREMNLMEAERAAIGRGNAGVIDIAEANARNRILERPGGDPNDPAGQRAILGARQSAEMRLANTQLQNSWNELASVGERAFDRIGEAITQGLTQGKITMASLGNIAKAVVSEIIQAFFRLSILNPLLNEIFGGTRGTTGGLWSIISGMISGRSGGGVGGDGSPSGGGWTGWVGGDGSVSGGGYTGSAMGNAFSGGNVIPFAAGGMVDRATVVPMALMGEAGPEAIIPLKRRSDGKLGVASDGGGGGGPTFNHSITINAQGADAGVEQKLRVWGAIVMEQTQKRIFEDISRGGLAAQAVGRRR